MRCFEDDDVIHVNGRVDPVEDISVINFELALADLGQVRRCNMTRWLPSMSANDSSRVVCCRFVHPRKASIFLSVLSIKGLSLLRSETIRNEVLCLISIDCHIAYVCSLVPSLSCYPALTFLSGKTKHVNSIIAVYNSEREQSMGNSRSLETLSIGHFTPTPRDWFAFNIPILYCASIVVCHL